MPSEAHEDVVKLLIDAPTPSDASLADRRAGFDAALSAMPIPDDVRAEVVHADGVPVDWVTVPGAVDGRVILMTHGGGYCMGSAATYREFAARISRATKARVAVADYRLAPEAPFPAAVDDCLAVYNSLLDEQATPKGVAIVGDSGGAGLALATMARARDEGFALPAAVVGFSPWIDIAVGDTNAEAPDVGDPMLSREAHSFFAGEYLQGHAATDPVVNPLYAELRGLPSLLLLTGTRDITHGDSLKLAQLAREAGVEVTVRTFHGLVHNWVLWPNLPESTEAVAEMAQFTDKHLEAERPRRRESVK